MAARKKVIDVPSIRYCVAYDDSGHEYAIPVDKKDEFYKWAYSGDDSECPSYATRIDGRFTFTDPKCD